MMKLVFIAVLTGCVLAGVAPKPPAKHDDKLESPSVKGVPLHSDHHAVETKHKSADVKPEVKQADVAKPHVPSVKDEHQHHHASTKTVEQHGHHDNQKHVEPHNAQVKAAHEQKPVVHEHQSGHPVKDVHKDKPKA